jgi:hypothetical protein
MNHLCDNTKGEKKAWVNELKSFGIKPIIKKIKSYDNKIDAIKDEEFFTKTFKDIGHPITNLKFGNAWIYTPKIRNKISEGVKRYFKSNPEAIKRHGEVRKGKKMHPNTAAKIHAAAILSREKAIIQFDKNENIINKFKSAAEAERQTGFHQSLISYCCNGVRKTHGGYVWKFNNDLNK